MKNKRSTPVEWLVGLISSNVDGEYWSNQQDITDYVLQAKAMEDVIINGVEHAPVIKEDLEKLNKRNKEEFDDYKTMLEKRSEYIYLVFNDTDKTVLSAFYSGAEAMAEAKLLKVTNPLKQIWVTEIDIK